MQNKYSTKEIIKRLASYAKNYKGALISALVMSVVGNIIGLYILLLIGKGVDTLVGINNVNYAVLIKLVVAIAVITAVSTLMYWIQNVSINNVAHNTIHSIRKDAFDNLVNLELRYFDTNSHGDILSRLSNDIDALSEGMVQGTYQLMSNVVGVISSFFFMMSISKKLTVIILIITPICIFIAYLITKSSSKYFKKYSEVLGELNGYSEEMVSNQNIVSNFDYQAHTVERFKEINEELREQGQKSQFYSSLTNPTTRLINNISYVLVCFIGGFMAINGQITVGMITSFLSYSTQFARPINEVTGVITQLQTAFASARRIFEIIDEKREQETGLEILEYDKADVSFVNVAFSYSQNHKLITNLNLNAKSGSTTAIVGPTGAGKTTLVNLLMRFYNVDKGKIQINGRNINDFTRNSVRQSMAMVLQDSWLFEGTIFENIAYGAENATLEQVIEAAKKARAHSFIKRLKDGYNTIIKHEEDSFSAGQKQLLTIARAMCTNASILLLDEATSSVDTKTEKDIQKAFSVIMEGKTSFVIAHRLSTIIDADMIVAMKDGDIVEQGTHKQLLEQKGFYAELYESQFENTKLGVK